jgi:hypothetical protein
MTYQIRLQGHLRQEWTEWFEGLAITAEEGGETLLTGRVDQSALHGLLRKVRDLGMPLLSVTQLESAPPVESDTWAASGHDGDYLTHTPSADCLLTDPN